MNPQAKPQVHVNTCCRSSSGVHTRRLHSLRWRDVSVGHFATPSRVSCMFGGYDRSYSPHGQVGDCTSLYFLYMCTSRAQYDHHHLFCPVETMVNVCLLIWLGDSLDDGDFFFVSDSSGSLVTLSVLPLLQAGQPVHCRRLHSGLVSTEGHVWF